MAEGTETFNPEDEQHLFTKGDQVTLSGLKSKPSWNGKAAVITGLFNHKKRRWPVKVINIGVGALILSKNLLTTNHTVPSATTKPKHSANKSKGASCPKCKKCKQNKKCMECQKSLCSKCGIIDDSVIDGEAVCRECVPLRCNECGRILIDANVWEECLVYCNGCNKRFCDHNLSHNCVAPLLDEYGQEWAWECRHCIKKPKIETNAETAQKYLKYLEEKGLSAKELSLKEWVSQQNDPSLRYKEKNCDPDLNLNKKQYGISKAKCSKEDIVAQITSDPGLMSRGLLENLYQKARASGRTPPPIRCQTCGSTDKEKYCMLRTHFIAYECIDCVIQHALNSRY